MYIMPKYWTGAKIALNGKIIYKAKSWSNFKLNTIFYEISESTYNSLKKIVVLEFLFAVFSIILIKLYSPHNVKSLFMFLLLAIFLGTIIQMLKNKFIKKNGKIL